MLLVQAAKEIPVASENRRDVRSTATTDISTTNLRQSASLASAVSTDNFFDDIDQVNSECLAQSFCMTPARI
jgi:hypothetical protein